MKRKFYPIAGTCWHCNDLIITVRPGQFKTCNCGKTSIDAGDELYWRAVGAIKSVWKMRKPKANTWVSWRHLKDFPLMDEHKNGY